jgi:hypothetical protein
MAGSAVDDRVDTGAAATVDAGRGLERRGRAWLVGTGYGFRLIRGAERAGGACPVRTSKR